MRTWRRIQKISQAEHKTKTVKGSGGNNWRRKSPNTITQQNRKMKWIGHFLEGDSPLRMDIERKWREPGQEEAKNR